MIYNGYYKVMSNIPKMGQLPTPELPEGNQPTNGNLGHLCCGSILPRPSPCAPHATAPGVGPKRFWTDDDGWEIPEMMGKS